MGKLYDLRTLDLTAATGTVAATTPAAGATAVAMIDVEAYDVLAISTLEQSGSWGAAVITLQLDDVSENREFPDDDMVDYLRTITDVGRLQNVDVVGHRVARLQLTTNQVGACTAALLVVGSVANETTFHAVLNANDLTARVGFDVQAFDLLYVEIADRAFTLAGPTWNTAVIEWKTSIDGVHWDSYSPAIETVEDGSLTLDVTDANYVAGHVTTAEGDLLILDITAFGRVQGDIAATDLSYTPGNPADWDDGVDPGDVDDALDQLAERVTDGEVLKKTLYATFPEVGDALFMVRVSQALTVTEVEAWTDTGTVDVQIEERATLDVSGTELLTADLVADDTGEATSAFDDDSVASGNYVVFMVKATAGSPEAVWCTVTGTLG